MCRAVRRVFRAGTHGEFIEVGLAHHDCASTLQPRHDCCIVRRLPSFENARRACCFNTMRTHVVFDCNRNSGKWADRATSGDVGIDCIGVRTGCISSHQIECMNIGLARFDGGEIRVDHLTCRDLAGSNGGSDCRCGGGDGCHDQSSNPMIGGTRKRR